VICKPAAANRKHGSTAADVLCVIRQRCETTGPDRIETEAGRMWRASHETIGAAVGISRHAAQRATTKLEQAGALIAEHHPAHFGDQTRSYRVVPDPEVWPEDGTEGAQR